MKKKEGVAWSSLWLVSDAHAAFMVHLTCSMTYPDSKSKARQDVINNIDEVLYNKYLTFLLMQPRYAQHYEAHVRDLGSHLHVGLGLH